MNQKSQKIVFFGNERLATGISTHVPVLKSLLKHGYYISAVIVKDEPSHSRKSRPLEIAEVAKAHNIPVLSPGNISEVIDELSALDADIGVLAAYGKIIPVSIINMFPCGIVNIHPSLLPRHRGPTPIESVILSGERVTGVSLMKLAKEMDTGPVYIQRTYNVPEKVSKQSLADSLNELGSDMLVECLPNILKNVLTPIPQKESLATYDNIIVKDDGKVDWRKSATILEREIRAYAGWPNSIAKIGNYQVIIKNADVIDTTGKPGDYVIEKDSLVVFCGHGSIKIKSLQPLGKKEMTVRSFLAGYNL
jgi:methionyl-tRNA formyltransferase